MKIGVIVGSLRKDSFNRKMANAVMKLAPQGLEFEVLEIGNLAFYNEELDANPPAEWVAFREKVKSKDGFLFFTPEYNRSVPAALKNALDIGSRPYGQSVWNGKPAGVVSVTIGNTGAFGANHHLRQTLVFLNMPTMAQPEAYISGAMQLFAENGDIQVESTNDFMKKYIDAFAEWVKTFVK